MFATKHTRRATTRPAAFEPLESRQLLSGTLAPADATNGITVAEVKSTLPVSALSGAKIKGAITLQLTNSGTVNDTGVNTFTVVASTDAVVDPTDYQLLVTPFSKKLNLKAGRTIHVTVPVKTVNAPATGAYDVLVSDLDPSGTTTTTQLTPAPALTVAAAYTQLSPVIGAVGPTAFTGAKTVSFKVTITNVGNVNSTGPLSTTLGLSLDGATVTTPLPTQAARKVTIKPGFHAVALTYHIKVPAGTTPGTYHIGATFSQGTATPVTVFSPNTITIGS